MMPNKPTFQLDSNFNVRNRWTSVTDDKKFKTVKYSAVMLHELDNLVECFTPQQLLRLATIFQWTMKQQLLTILLKPTKFTSNYLYQQWCRHTGICPGGCTPEAWNSRLKDDSGVEVPVSPPARGPVGTGLLQMHFELIKSIENASSGCKCCLVPAKTT